MERLETVTELLGGRKTLRADVRTLLELAERVRGGLPPKAFEVLAEKLQMTEEELTRALGIPRRTLTRRKRQPKLPPRESEAVVRLARVAGLAAEVLGDVDAAHRWLKSPNRALGGRTPLSLLDTAPGAELVTDVLERIEHGSYS